MSLPASDNFNRADAANLGSNWTEQATGGEGGVGILSNAAVPNDNSNSFYQPAFWNADSFNANHYSEIVVKTPGNTCGPIVRASGTGASKNNYWILARDSSLGSSYIFKTVADVFTAVAGPYTITLTAGDTLRLEVDGTTLTFKQNGSTIGSGTDSDLATGSPGVICKTDDAIESWTADDIGGGGVAQALTGQSETGSVGTAIPGISILIGQG